MTENERIELREYCAKLLKKYGFDFVPTDPALPAIYVIHKEMQECIDVNRKFAKEVENASSKINPKVFHFNHAGEAWKFQLAMALKWILCGGLLGLSAVIGIWYWSLSNDIDRARAIIKTHDNLSQMAAIAEKNRDGSYFVDLSEARGDTVQHFRENKQKESSDIFRPRGIMEKKLIIRFLKAKRRGAYNLLVECYASQIFLLSKAMAVTVIEEDLASQCGSPITLNYFSLARAMTRYKKKHPTPSTSPTKPASMFKDAHELKEGQISPITFNLPPKK